LFLIPTTIINLMVAFAYCKAYNDFWLGFLMASAIIFVSTLTAGVIAFLIGKWLFADYIRAKLDKSKSPRVKKWRIIDSMFITSGIMLVALLRLMFIPFGLVSYMLGVTSVTFCDFFIGSLIYIVKVMLIVLVGCTIWQASDDAMRNGTENEANSNEIIILVVEIVVTIVITIVVTCWAKTTLDKKFDEVEREEEVRKR
jgi:uncharacterized membrane protein YdjX (TVP38/TMEM64 family)